VETASKFGYARPKDGAYIAYRVDGGGPIDIVWQPDWFANIDVMWQNPWRGRWLRELASFARLITHDPRGVGLSSRTVDLPTLETRVSDLLTVLGSTGSRRPVLAGEFVTGAVHVLLAALRPSLPRALVWLEPSARHAWAPDYPWGSTDEERQLEHDFIGLWGTDAYAKTLSEGEEAIGNTVDSPEGREHIPTWSRNTCTPDVAARLSDIWYEIDVRGVLDAVKTPTLLLVHEERKSYIEEAEYIASRMSAAEVRTLPGSAWTVEEQPAWAEQIRHFAGISRPHVTFQTVLSTVLFTDIVGATERQAALGDRGWHGLVQQHHAIVRGALKRWHGVENDTAGDGFYATFDGPARAIRCALDATERVRDLGIEIRAGIHTGECELIDGKLSGVSVTTGSRVAANAGPSEVLASQTVKDLVAGSGLVFDDAGEHELKGLPDRWHLYRVLSD
jgi:class 3 adenylate cyclase